MNEVVRITASFLYVGYLPLAPGTFGSIAGLLIAYFLPSNLPFCTFSLSLLGCLICEKSRIVFKKDDPSNFVLDEVCGMMLSVLYLPKALWVYGLAFVLFRAGDVLKPWPVSLIQRHKSPWSIMGDDLAVGFFVNLILQATLHIQL